MIPSTMEPVSRNTNEQLNEEVSRRIHDSVVQFAQAPPERLEGRLTELNREWDTDRLLVTVSAAVMLAGLALAVVTPWCLLLSVAAGAYLFAHGVCGWDPLRLVERRCGFRTSTEIEYERYALKAVRGDFQKLTGFITPDDRDAIARLEGEGGPVYNGPTIPHASDAQVVQEALDAAQK
jgi:hypothetical protein